MAYDKNNIFAKILRGEIPCEAIDEDEYTLSFADINPQAPIHILVIPKGLTPIGQISPLNASGEEISAFFRAICRVAELMGISETGYRVISNIGPDSHQEVPHLHMHVLGGTPIGPLVVAKG